MARYYDIAEFLRDCDADESAPVGKPKAAGLLYQKHPESGGPFGGRDNALTAFGGYHRRKRFDYDTALDAAIAWNRTCCDPPLPEATVREAMARFWAQWREGADPDDAPGEAQQEGTLAFLTLPDMNAVEKERGELSWHIKDVLPRAGLVYFSSPPSSGKTWLLLDLARAAVTGGDWIGKYPVEQTAVLYIDEEMGVVKSLPRIRKLGFREPMPGWWYTDKAGVKFDDTGHLRQILAHCQEHGVGMVIIDTLTRVHNLDENDNSAMRYLYKRFSVLIDAGISVIVAHHDRKRGADDSVKHERMRGAGELAASADMAYAVDKVGRAYRLSTSKGRLVQEDDQVDVTFVIEDSPDGTRTTLREVTPEERMTARSESAEKRVLAAVIDAETLSTNEMASASGCRKGDAIAAAKRLVDTGSLEARKVGQTVYYCIPGSAGPEG